MCLRRGGMGGGPVMLLLLLFATGASSEMTVVALTVGGWFASALISKVIDRLKSYLEDNHDLGADVNDRLATLEVALPRIEAAINAAEATPIRDPDLVAWLRRLKDAVYRADDMLDDLESRFLYDRLKNENKVRAFKSSKMETLKRTILTDDDLKNLKNLAQHLKGIYDDLKNLKNLAQHLKGIYDDIYRRLPELTNYIKNIRSATRKYISAPPEVIGRNKETKYMVSNLLSYREEEGTSSALLSLAWGASAKFLTKVKTMISHCIYMDHFTSLKSIYLSSCNKFTSLPTLGQLSSLMILHIEALPELRKIGVEVYGNGYKVFPSLEDLKLQNLEEFEEWSEVQGRQLFPHLKKLHIENCLNLTKLTFLTLNSPIKELKINSCGDVGSALPECLQRFTLLTMLKISHYPHVTSLSLSNLVALENLCLSNCSELSSLGDLRSLSKLKQPEITGCPKLTSSN